MATVVKKQPIKPTRISQFLGLNICNTGDTQLKLGESGNMDNFYITSDYKLRKIYGYKSFFEFDSQIKGMFSTKIGSIGYLLVAAGGKLYSFLQEDLEDSDDYFFNNKKKFDVDASTNTFDVDEKNLTSISIVLYCDEEPEGYPIDISGAGQEIILETGRIIFDIAFIEAIIQNTTNPYFEVTYSRVLEPTEIGTIPNSDCSFFEFDNKIYILCGGYYKWDGTTFEEVEGYIPKVFISTPPSGGGTLYDELNMLTGKKHMTFNGDGSSTEYHLAQNNIASVDKVIVNGTETTAYTVNLATGVVTFTTAPSGGVPDNVDIYWTKDDGDRSIIEGMKFGTIFGGDYDTRVFLYGNPTCQNRVYFSGISYPNGIAVPSVEYFPATSQIDIGPSNFAVTDLTRQYNRLLVTTNKPEAYYLESSTESLSVTLVDQSTTTRLVPSISTHPLNEVHGNVAMGQGKLIKNYPVTIDRHGFTLWKATNVRDEKNIEDISIKIKSDLQSLPLNLMKTLDYQIQNQMWFCVDNRIYIYNYENGTYSRIRIADTLTDIVELNGSIYTALEDGRVVKWGEEYTTFDGETIDAVWEMSFSDYGVPQYRKTMRKMWVVMQPQGDSSADIGYVTNITESPVTKHISYKMTLLDDVNFADFTFQVANNPQPFRLKLKAKKFTNMKIVIKNNEQNDCTILELIMNIESFGESK